MRKRIAYFNPVIGVKTRFDKGGEILITDETCRESVISLIWQDVKEECGFSPYGLPIGNPEQECSATGRRGAVIKLSFGVPAESNEYEYDDSLLPTPRHSFVKRIVELKTSNRARQELSLLLDVLAAVPAMMYAGPRAYAAHKVSSHFKFHTTRNGFDYDGPHEETDLDYVNLTNCILQHPVLMSIILGQMRWGIEEFARGRYDVFNKKLNLRITQARLAAMSKRPDLRPADKAYLLLLFKKMVLLSNTMLVMRRLERYPINRTFARHTLQFLRSGNGGKKLYETWSKTVGGNIYGSVGSYGFYRWFELSVAKTAQQKKLLDVVKKQSYSDTYERVFELNG